MKIYLSFLFTTFFYFSVCAQSVVESTSVVREGLNSEEFTEAKTRYLKMIESETYKNGIITSKNIFEKICGDLPQSLMYEEEWLSWVTENLAYTKFKSVSEAIELRKVSIELFRKQLDENKEFYLLFECASADQVHAIFNIGRPF